MPHEPDYSFARTPKWVISHLLVLSLVVVMIGAGLWQIDRHTSRGERNESVRDRSQQDPVALHTVVSLGADPSIGEDEQFRRVFVKGEFRVEDEVLIRNRTFEGAPGWWVLTPFVTDDGWAVAVNRGWIPLSFDDEADRPGTEPISGSTGIVGTIQPTRTAEGFQVADPEVGQLSSLGRPDVARLATQVDYPLMPVVLRVEASTESGAATTLPRPLALPALDSGPHASYAVQWFVFTTIALVGYPLVLRRVARGRADSLPSDDL